MKSILITGRRWFEKTNGNTYFSAKAYIDGIDVSKIEFEYGYGDQYLYEMFYQLEKEGLIPKFRNSEGYSPSPRIWCQENGIELLYDVADVDRKRDL